MRNQSAILIAVIAIAAAGLSITRPVERPGLTGWSCATGQVQWMKLSPDDRTAAFIVRRPTDLSVLRQLMVVDADNWAVLVEDEGLYPTNICFSSTGDRLAVMWNRVIAVYDLNTMEDIRRIPVDDEFSLMNGAIGFSPSGEQIVVLRHQVREVVEERAWELSTGELTTDYQRPTVWDGIGLSPDGTTFRTGGWPGPTPRVSRLDDPEFRTYCFYFPYHLYCTFTADSRSLLTVHPDGMVNLWELQNTGTNARVLKFEANTGLEAFTLLSLTSTSERLVYLDADGKIQFFTLFTRKRNTSPAADNADGSVTCWR